MTHGIKKNLVGVKAPRLFTTTGDWLPARFVGLGANHAAKEWKTRAGAERAAKRFGGEVFTITETMNY